MIRLQDLSRSTSSHPDNAELIWAFVRSSEVQQSLTECSPTPFLWNSEQSIRAKSLNSNEIIVGLPTLKIPKSTLLEEEYLSNHFTASAKSVVTVPGIKFGFKSSLNNALKNLMGVTNL